MTGTRGWFARVREPGASHISTRLRGFMPLKTLFINGPAGGGKSTVARLIAREVLHRPTHLVRLNPAKDGYTNAVELMGCPGKNGHWASCHRVIYTADRIFETLPDGLRAVRALDPAGLAIVEADGDPAVRHAYPYDYRVFVMPSPTDVHAVFREPWDAAQALHQVMQDTAAFASEIFGLFDADGLDDSFGVRHSKLSLPRSLAGMPQRIERLDIAEKQIDQFAGSPIGAEIASRIQLQPDYHALVEADVVLINTGMGGDCDSMKECVRRIEKLLSRVRHDARHFSVLYWGNFARENDPALARLVERFRNLLEQ